MSAGWSDAPGPGETVARLRLPMDATALSAVLLTLSEHYRGLLFRFVGSDWAECFIPGRPPEVDLGRAGALGVGAEGGVVVGGEVGPQPTLGGVAEAEGEPAGEDQERHVAGPGRAEGQSG